LAEDADRSVTRRYELSYYSGNKLSAREVIAPRGNDECPAEMADMCVGTDGLDPDVLRDRVRNFELMVLPHRDTVHSLATWLTGNLADAEDVVQEVYFRAFRYFDSYQGGNYRLWLLTIVRNTFITWVKVHRSHQLEFHGDVLAGDAAGSNEPVWGSAPRDPEMLLAQHIDSELLQHLIQRLPENYREALLLREYEDLTYRDIAKVTGVPIGTVMSRLSRARLALRQLWVREA
jgi:RNA polymerase sigma-70 factor, ECF subfamily